MRVDRGINESEAAVVREIFRRCASGEGLVTIAKSLNAAGAVAPRAQQQRPTAWAPTTVREILHREQYHGVIVWGKTQKRNAWGQARRSQKPTEAWIRVDAPPLRLVEEAVWEAVQTRLAAMRANYLRDTKGRLWGRPGEGTESKYLLTGLIRCGACGGSIYVKSRSHGRHRAFFYGCTSYHLRGRTVCGNNIEVPMEATNRLVLDAFASEILQPEHVERAIREALVLLQPSEADRMAQRAALQTEQAAIDQDLDQLTAAIVAGGGTVATIVAAMKTREGRRKIVQRELASVDAAPVDGPQLEQDARGRLDEWRDLLQREAVGPSRQMLKKLLAEPLRAQPVADSGSRGWELSGRGSLGKLLGGMRVANTVASPTGLDDFCAPIRFAVAA